MVAMSFFNLVKNKMPNKKRLVLGLVIFVAVVGGGVSLWYMQRKADTDKKEGYQKALDITAKTAQSKNYQQGIADLESYYNENQSSLSKEQKIGIIGQVGATYLNAKQPDKALEWFKKAETLNGLDYGMAMTIGNAARQKGDKKMAIEYYQKAIEFIKNDGDSYNDEYIGGITKTIEELQAQP